ncbi:putative DNA-binding domain-containing protein [Paraburkholderia edwinii]|uniref:DNA-binding domain-containing protein n=1 Tax=Paraburkholderia edwinii TaxID=2861782 RepID=A0ABX8UNC0_9BURK|nr:DNA-binding domain-containing protein [Paraburkholderia edwinii]QYD68765.1 putative DNA-binding domain-containing protein [Paraburkholderia edwinii]
MKARLDVIEQAFADAIRDPRKESALLELLSTEPQVAARRLDIYRGNAYAHWHAALKNAYPVLLALVGEHYFSTLARAYAETCSSHSGDLNQYGAQLAAFIDNRERDPRYAYFADIARLEWAVHTASHASEPAALSASQWQQFNAETLLACQLIIHPACRAISSRYAISAIWRGHQPGGTLPQSIDAPSQALVVRPEWRCLVVDQTDAAHAAFIALQRRRTLNEAIDIALAIDEQFDISSQLQTWILMCAVIDVVSDGA